MSENQTGNVSRRDLLKKGAVAGGIVWTAPLIMSDVAGAQTDAGSPSEIGECTTFYRAKWERNGNNTAWNACTTGVGAQDCLGARDATYGSACPLVLPAQGPPQPRSGGGYVIYVPQYIDGKEVQNVQGATKGGSGDGSCAVTDGMLLSLAESQALGYSTRVWRVVFPSNAPNGGALSHAEIIFCV